MYSSPLEQFDMVVIYRYSSYLINNYEISLFHGIIILLLIAVGIQLLLYAVYDQGIYLIPHPYQLILEKIYNLINNIIKQQSGEKGLVYFPLVFTLFIFILSANIFSLLPFSFALTSHIINIFFLTLSLITGLFLLGCINLGFNFFKLFIPESPFLLLFLLIPIELFSYAIRAFSMALRLSANIMAGHTLVFIVSGFLIKLSTMLLILSSTVLIAIFVLEFGVAILQAYVFTVLFTIYLRDSLYQASH